MMELRKKPSDVLWLADQGVEFAQKKSPKLWKESKKNNSSREAMALHGLLHTRSEQRNDNPNSNRKQLHNSKYAGEGNVATKGNAGRQKPGRRSAFKRMGGTAPVLKTWFPVEVHRIGADGYLRFLTGKHMLVSLAPFISESKLSSIGTTPLVTEHK